MTTDVTLKLHYRKVLCNRQFISTLAGAEIMELADSQRSCRHGFPMCNLFPLSVRNFHCSILLRQVLLWQEKGRDAIFRQDSTLR